MGHFTRSSLETFEGTTRVQRVNIRLIPFRLYVKHVLGVRPLHIVPDRPLKVSGNGL